MSIRKIVQNIADGRLSKEAVIKKTLRKKRISLIAAFIVGLTGTLIPGSFGTIVLVAGLMTAVYSNSQRKKLKLLKNVVSPITAINSTRPVGNQEGENLQAQAQMEARINPYETAPDYVPEVEPYQNDDQGIQMTHTR